MSDRPPAPARGHSPEDPQERLRHYRLDRFVKSLPTLARPRGDIDFDPARDDVRKYYVEVPVESLADLKLWMGFPNDHIDHARYWQHLRAVAAPQMEKHVGPSALKGVAPDVIANAEHNVLFGFIDEVLLAEPFWHTVVEGLLVRHKKLLVLIVGDLVVEDGETVTFSNTPTAYFNKVTIYGTGKIKLKHNCKIIADTIEHIASRAPAGTGKLHHPTA